MAWSLVGTSGWLHEGLAPLLVLALVGHAYTATLLIGCALRRSPVLLGTAFSARKYYLIMGWAPLTVVALALLLDARFLLFALLAAVAGILGEILIGLAWSRFFAPPIWTYSYRALLHGRTAAINVLPWIIGALLFLSTGRLLGVDPRSVAGTASSPLWVGAAALAAGTAASWLVLALLWRHDGRARRFTVARFAIFCSPIAVTALALAVFCDPRYPLLMVAFSVVGTATEYAYGRSMSLFFERPLWTYHHLQIDGGHSSMVTLPLWALGGLYFFWIAAQLGLA